MRQSTVIMLVSLALAVMVPAQDRPTRVVMMDFTSDDNLYRSSVAAVRYSDLIQARFDNAPGVTWVEREQLTRAAEEFHLQKFGFAGNATALRFGRWLKADLLIRGRFERPSAGPRVLKLEIVDPQRADVVAVRELAVAGDRRDPVLVNMPDVEQDVAELAAALTEARQALVAAGSQRHLGALFFRNLSPTPRLDFLGEDILDAFEKAGALRFPRSGESLAESELSVLGLTDESVDAWKRVAEVYAWGSYEELPAKEAPFDQLPVALTFTLWDGQADLQTLAATGTVRELPHLIAAMVGEANAVVAHRLPIEASATVRDDVAARLVEQARKVVNRPLRVRLLETAAFFTPESKLARRALLDARWNTMPGAYAACCQAANDLERYFANFDRDDDRNVVRLLNAYAGVLAALQNRGVESTVPPDLPDAIAEQWQADVAHRIVAFTGSLNLPRSIRDAGGTLYNVLEYVNDPAARLRAVEALWPLFKPEYVKQMRQQERQWYVMRDIESGLYRACSEAGQPGRIKDLLKIDPELTTNTASSARRRVDSLTQWRNSRNRAPAQPGPAGAPTNAPALPELSPVMRPLALDRVSSSFGQSPGERRRVASMAYTAGRLWVDIERVAFGGRGSDPRLFRYEIASDDLTALPVASRVNAFLAEGSSLWLATANEGAIRFDMETGALTNFTGRDGLLTAQLSALAKAAGRIYVGGNAPKLNYFDLATHRWGDSDVGITGSNFVGSGHWLLSRTRAGTLVDVNTGQAQSLAGSFAAVASDASGFWLLDDKDLIHLKPDGGESKRWRLPFRSARYLLVDGDFLWIANDTQVAFWSIPGEEWRGTFQVEGRITSLAASPTRLWIGREHESAPLIEVESPGKMIVDAPATNLWQATYMGQIDVVDKLLAAGEDANRATKQDWTPLMAAIRSGQTGAARRLLERGAKVTPASLVLAAELGHADVMDLLLQGNAPADSAWRGQSPLHAAAAHGHAEVVRQLIARGVDQYRTNPQGWTALGCAIANGDRAMTRLLLDVRPKPDPHPEELTYLLDLAAEHHHPEIVGELLDWGANVNAPDGTCPILLRAAESGEVAIARLALQRGARIESERATPMSFGSGPTVWYIRETALALAAEHGQLEMMDLLIEAGLKPDKKLRDGTVGGQALICAATHDQVSAVEKLLQAGVPIDERDDNGMTALMWAAKQEIAPAATQLLLEKGADTRLRNRQGKTAAELTDNSELLALLRSHDPTTTSEDANPWLLRYELGEAAEAGELSRLDVLLGAGADPNSSVPGNCPALVRAAAAGHDAAAEHLLKAGAAIARADGSGWTPLMHAAGNNRQAVVALLVRHGADVRREDRNGLSALDIALARGHRDVAAGLAQASSNAPDGRVLIDGVRMRNSAIVKLLLDNGEPVNGVDADGRTAVFHAVHWDNPAFYRTDARLALEMLDLLLARGADINHADSDGQTPLMAAITHEQVLLDVIQFLVDHGARVDPKDRHGASAAELARSIVNAGQRESVLKLLQSAQERSKPAGP